MAAISRYRYELIQHILERIAECEGGIVELTTDDDGALVIELTPDIPPHLWCADCKRRAICKAKLLARWNQQTIKR